MIPQFYRGSEGALVVFDLTKADSFYNVATWVDEIHQHAPPDLPIVLVGNKSDLDNQRKISSQQATYLAEQLNLSYIETSALNSTNVEQAFILLVTSIYEKKATQSIVTRSLSTSSADQIDESNTKPVEQEKTVIFDEPIRLRNGKKNTNPSGKKNGCCVIS